jgi:hypothetical protein
MTAAAIKPKLFQPLIAGMNACPTQNRDTGKNENAPLFNKTNGQSFKA